MQKGWLPGAMFVLAAVIIVHTGCGGSTAISNPPTQPTHGPPQSASTTVPLAANMALPIPAVAGVSGTFTESAGVTAGTTVKLTSYESAPAGAPAPLAIVRRPLSGPSLGFAIFLVSQAYSAPTTFHSFPVTAWQLPASLAGAGPFELETIDGTTGLLLDTEVDTSVSGAGVVSFPGSSATFATASGHTYWWELITGFASPPPTGCGSSTVTVTVNPAGETVPQPVLCNFTGSLQISPNNAPPGVSMNVSAYVPAQSGTTGPPAPPGTTTGLISVAADVLTQSIAFNSGFFKLAVRLPSNIPAAGKSFFASSCTIKAAVSHNGSPDYLGCIDTPVTSGPLALTGQTVSVAGLSSPITLSASGVSPTCHKICPPTLFYYYTTSIYY